MITRHKAGTWVRMYMHDAYGYDPYGRKADSVPNSIPHWKSFWRGVRSALEQSSMAARLEMPPVFELIDELIDKVDNDHLAKANEILARWESDDASKLH